MLTEAAKIVKFVPRNGGRVNKLTRYLALPLLLLCVLSGPCLAHDSLMVVVKTPNAANATASASVTSPAYIDGVSFFPGFTTPMHEASPKSALSGDEKSLTLEVLNAAGEVIYSQPFRLLEYIQVPMAIPGDADAVPPTVRVPEPEAVLFLPALPGATSLRVSGKEGASESVAIPKAIQIPPTSVLQPSPSPAKVFDVLILASGFRDMTQFQQQASAIRSLLEVQEPFASRLNNINIQAYENTADLGCYNGCNNIDRLMCCDTSKVLAAAARSSLPFDEIIVVHDTATYSGGGYRDLGNYENNSASSYAMIYNGSWTPSMALHEFGHSFANLCDEYTYGSEGYSYNTCVNCQANCNAWSTLSPTCTRSCDARSDYFRPEDSIMLTLGIDSFNAASIQLGLTPRLNFFADINAPTPPKLPGILPLLLD